MAKAELRRHKRKYAEGALGEDKSFYFRGPQGKLNLRAQNITLFMQIAEGMDEATWAHHLKRNDYSTWMREAVKDDTVADEIALIEKNAFAAGQRKAAPVSSKPSAKHYTAPA